MSCHRLPSRLPDTLWGSFSRPHSRVKVSSDFRAPWPSSELGWGAWWELGCCFLPPASLLCGQRLCWSQEVGAEHGPGMGSLSPLPPAGLWGPARALGSCAWAAGLHLCEGVWASCPGNWAQALLFSQKFQPFKDQGPERDLFQAARELFFQLGGITRPGGRVP